MQGWGIRWVCVSILIQQYGYNSKFFGFWHDCQRRGINPRILQGQKWACNRGSPWNINLTLQPLQCILYLVCHLSHALSGLVCAIQFVASWYNVKGHPLFPLYGIQKGSQEEDPPLIESEVGIYVRYKQVFNSPTKERIWYMKNRLANHPHNNPFILFTNFINHIKSYGSLVLMTAEKFRYVTFPNLDVIRSRLSQRI